VCHGYGQLAEGFLSHFSVIADPARVVVAPEALSRFYLDRTRGGTHAASDVGASWMTRADRASEIADQITYLDTVHDLLIARLDPARVRLTAFGFSQGVATACRWVVHTRARVDRVICWGGAIPDDVSLTADTPLRRAALRLVRGSRDEFATTERVAEQVARLHDAGVTFVYTEFEGGHRLDGATLQQLAAEQLVGAV
jgi:predicted esterase